MAKHYAVADLHGMYDVYEQIQGIVDPGDTVYFLGDAADRGYDSFKTMQAIYDNPQWVYLKGNHEDLMAKGLRNLRDYDFTGNKEDYELWMWNGGTNTLKGWEKAGADYSWIEKLDNLPLKVDYTNPKGITFHMTHAGYTCGHRDEMWSDRLVWSRDHFFSPWDEDYFPNEICIHGHTPIEYLVRTLSWRDKVKPFELGFPEARVYCDGHKIDIDNGVFYTKSTVLYDLDEMVAIPIYSNANFEW